MRFVATTQVNPSASTKLPHAVWLQPARLEQATCNDPKSKQHKPIALPRVHRRPDRVSSTVPARVVSRRWANTLSSA